jgi:WD40 repeat protein
LSRFLESHPSWEEDRTTWQTSFSSLSARWGDVLRTIKAESGRFTHMAVAGQRIVTVCGNSTINVYDAVTGVLRLTLKTLRRVTNIAGSWDGSILFCAHQGFHGISLWDMQTGGLIHTFAAKSEISNITVSLTGRYLASCSPDGTVRFWNVESRREGSRSWDNRVVHMCWLEPEDHVALGFRKTVVVLEMTTGRALHIFSVGPGIGLRAIPVGERVGGIAYSAGQYRLAVCLTSRTESRIVVLDIRTGLVSVSFPLTDLVSFTFSGNGGRVVCASGTNDLRFFDTTILRPQWYNYPSNFESIASISLLRSGHLVVNAGDSIQLLATEYAQPSYAGLDPGVSCVYPLNNSRAICAYSRDHNDVYILDTEALKTLANYRIESGPPGPSSPLLITCVSLDQYIAVLCIPEHGQFASRLEVIGSVLPQWESPLLPPLPSSAISPDGKTMIIAGRYGSSRWKINVRRVSDGRILSVLIWEGESPRNIGFTSDTQFYVEHGAKNDDKEALASITASATTEAQFHTKDLRVDRRIRATFALTPAEERVDLQELSWRWIPPASPYELDESLEWVVDGKSRKVCWLPPDYVSGVENGYFFVGSSIVTAGRDGILRKLTFREPRLNS